MNAVFHCPVCNTPLGTPDDPRPDPLPPCAICGWRAGAVKSRSFGSSLLLWLLLMLVAGVAGGAIIGHSLLLVPIAFGVFGVGPAVAIARNFEEGRWLLMVAYCIGLFVGLMVFPDGGTMPGWIGPAWVAGASAFCGLVAGLFQWRN